MGSVAFIMDRHCYRSILLFLQDESFQRVYILQRFFTHDDGSLQDCYEVLKGVELRL